MAKVTVKITEVAFNDIDLIAEYYSEASAKKKIKAVYHRLDDLEKNPLRGRPIPELQDKNIRHIDAGNYRIIYHVIDEYLLMILRVFHHKRSLDPDKDLDFNY